MEQPTAHTSAARAVRRTRIWFAGLLFVVGLFVVRSFYLQIIHYSYYHKQALSDQLKQYTIPATRGIIEAQDGDTTVPIVLNQTLYTIYVDPSLVKNVKQEAADVVAVLGGQASNYESLMSEPTRYEVLANKVTANQEQAILNYKQPGIGAQAQDYRTYPQGSLASQTLGFVNDDGQGEYGLEQALNPELAGKPGLLKAVTDINGVPLAADGNNISIPPTPGDNIVLTLNLSMQAQMEQILANEYKATKSQGLSAIIMDPNTGQIKAMANYPTYDPSNFESVTDPTLFQNAAVDNAIEPGSSMKTLTTSAALDQGVIQPNESFYDPAHWVVDGFNITDIEEDGGARQQNIASILNLSLNTGATWMLMQMSQPGGTQITQKGIDAWHDYMVNHFLLGQPTGIEQGYESAGLVPPDDPSEPALALSYANTAFGQGVQLTALQLGAALSSVLNGGTYYQPTLVAQTIAPNGTTTVNKPKVLKSNVVSPKVGQELIPLMQYVVQQHLLEGFSYLNFPSNYLVGGKTGTAQVVQPGGGYSSTVFNGTYVGFLGGSTKPQYVIVVFNIKPNVTGYAGSYGGQPVFADLAHMLINNSFVTPEN
jgi:cell division protein FtsI/penicillin-binding protein 2